MTAVGTDNIPASKSSYLPAELFARFEVIRFPLIIAVIYIHNYPSLQAIPNRTSGSASALTYVINMISYGVAGIAVPLFFFISGFLYFKDGPLTSSSHARKVRSRLTTLVVPFLFWNVAVLCLYLVGRYIPQTAPFFRDEAATTSLIEFVKALFGIGRDPIAYQFWFIRNLMILVLCAPLINIAIRIAGLVFLAGIALIWVFTTSWPARPTAESLLFFSTGAYLAFNRINPFKLDRFALILVIASIMLFALSAALRPLEIGFLVGKTGIVLGLPAALGLSGVLLTSRSSQALTTLAAASFFVFALHEPLLTVFRKVLLKVLPLTTDAVAAIYFLLPLAIAALSVAAFFLLKAVAPKFTGAITGGRAA
jgi:surface polysaccharide O-acyltransferase-like enzyme